MAVSSKENIKAISALEYSLLGGKIAPFEAWLVLRGLRTLSLRMERHSRSAMKLAEFLEKHPKVTKVNYPGLESFPQYELAKKQMSGFSGLFSFELDTDLDGIKKFLNNLSYFKIGVSWGGYESLVYAPIISLSKELPEEKWQAAGIHPGIVRVSVGLENVAFAIRKEKDCNRRTDEMLRLMGIYEKTSIRTNYPAGSSSVRQ